MCDNGKEDGDMCERVRDSATVLYSSPCSFQCQHCRSQRWSDGHDVAPLVGLPSAQSCPRPATQAPTHHNTDKYTMLVTHNSRTVE